MANEDHLEILKQGVKAWNEWREQNAGVKPDLIGADLRGAIPARASDLDSSEQSCSTQLTEASSVLGGRNQTQ